MRCECDISLGCAVKVDPNTQLSFWCLCMPCALIETTALAYLLRSSSCTLAAPDVSGGVLCSCSCRTTATVAVKGCVALLKLWHQGPPEAVRDSWASGVNDLLRSVGEVCAPPPHTPRTHTNHHEGGQFGAHAYCSSVLL